MKPSGEQKPGASDVFGTKEVLQLVIKKLASQSLSFGLAIAVVLVGAWNLSRNSLPIVIALLFVFTLALAGYLFVEQQGKLQRHDPAALNRLMEEKMKRISNPASDFTVEVSTAPLSPEGARDVAVSAKRGKADYRIGQKIVVSFRASRDCYVTLLNIGTSGKLTVLFPNGLHRDNFVQGGRDYEIPSEDYGFDYELQGPPGVERIKAVATLKKVELLEPNFAPDGSVFRTVEAASGARDIRILQKKVDAVPGTDWAEAACEFTVS